MRPSISIVAFSFFAAISATTIQADEAASGFVEIQATDVPYEPHSEVPELGHSILSGHPSEAGVYVIRLKIPPGLTFPPHYHDQDRHITVISGVWAFGKGYSGSCDDTISLTAGAYVMHPEGGVHFDGACGEEPVEVQIIGQGPVKTTWIDEPD